MQPEDRRKTPPWQSWLLDMSRLQKRLVLAAIDFALLAVALWGAISVRYGYAWVPETVSAGLLAAAAPLITVAIFFNFGVYRLVTRYIGYRGTWQIFLLVGLSVLIWSLLVFMSGQLGVPRSVVIGYGVTAAVLIALSRQAAGLILKSAGIRVPVFHKETAQKPVVIYGAGQMGVELLQALSRVRDRNAVGFIDPAPSLWGQKIGGIKVYRPDKLERLIEREGVREVLLAMPEHQRRERRQILQELERYSVEVKILPAFEDIAAGRVGIADLRPVEVGDLLGREPVQPKINLLERNTRGKAILVTGAGGSIGSELVRQILKLSPKRLVLFDVSEPALYEIDMEARALTEALGAGQHRPSIHAVLGSVLDAALVTETLTTHTIETVYHAAAYKHVPIVELNPVVGLTNNVFGAAVLADCASRLGVERVVLISTDKAVRPTNVMGASKRLSELVLQAKASEGGTTVFTMVRFGNVLDSSGSVVRLFRKQIKAGGPVTVTDPEVERYFMSIPEAAELVIQAGAMATGGEVFVLHMGDAVKIDDLARLMIHLSGLEVRDDDNPAGDIEIKYTGLRPGEKLYEELLIGANTTGTEHPRILRSDEPFLPPAELAHELDVLEAAMTSRDVQAVQAVLTRTVEGYHPSGEEIDAGASARATWTPASRTLH
ncbi:MAG: polysaccharide biosynthesis protein [Hyphomicrobium sp.]